MISGLLMGLATLGFAACLLLVMNGKAEKWMQQLRGAHQAPLTKPSAGEK